MFRVTVLLEGDLSPQLYAVCSHQQLFYFCLYLPSSSHQLCPASWLPAAGKHEAAITMFWVRGVVLLCSGWCAACAFPPPSCKKNVPMGRIIKWYWYNLFMFTNEVSLVAILAFSNQRPFCRSALSPTWILTKSKQDFLWLSFRNDWHKTTLP